MHLHVSPRLAPIIMAVQQASIGLLVVIRLVFKRQREINNHAILNCTSSLTAGYAVHMIYHDKGSDSTCIGLHLASTVLLQHVA
jgi:hypothetical protein